MAAPPDDYPPLAALPKLTLHPSVDAKALDAAKVVADWLSSLTQGLASGAQDDIRTLFLEKESWWRDFVSFSWDIATHNGTEAISKYITSSTSGFAEPKTDLSFALQPQLMEMGPFQFIQSGFSFKNKFGTGRGILRLANVGPDEWKAWTVSTILERLNGQDELEAKRLKEQAIQSSPSGHGIPSKEDTDLQVLIVGAGQAGLALAAHLQHLGLKYLVVEKASGPGAAWRARYASIKSHTPSFTDHFPFLKYPTNWPRYLDRDHIIQWIEHYADIMGLNIRNNTLARNIVYDESAKRYSVELQSADDGSVQTVSPKHLVLATGLLSDIPIKPTFPGQDLFRGEISHTSEHRSAALLPDVQSKKFTIIGAGTSAHDVAQDLVNHGAKSVTMVQRSPMFVVSTQAVEEFQLKIWHTPGLSTEDADLLGNSLPTALVRTLGIGGSQMMSAFDKDLLDALEKAGMAVKRGDTGDSLADHQFIKAGHFYADQGACEMIIDGRIQVRQCGKGVQAYTPDGIVLGDGTKIESDVVILATSIERTHKAIEQLMPKEVIDRVGEICSLDESQERVGVWRPTGMPGFWFMTGSFIWARQFSPLLALQIAAVEWGLNSEYQW
ncbi:hypothetical protein BJY01DRAFT_262845 [Aspergillus pseudoustus]|uniref:FAD/NAD(P)-binding domain-containing protein n=1 Tax=Aspergillus pseudoustus TaxID=1810923 RepID=A0ABR4K6C9_9EURO